MTQVWSDKSCNSRRCHFIMTWCGTFINFLFKFSLRAKSPSLHTVESILWKELIKCIQINSNKIDEKAAEHGNVESNMLLQFWNNYMSSSTEAPTSCSWHCGLTVCTKYINRLDVYVSQCALTLYICLSMFDCQSVHPLSLVCFYLKVQVAPLTYLDSNNLFDVLAPHSH